MNSPLLKEDTEYTWEDYMSWDDDVRYELIDGVAYAMGAPSQRHQSILGDLYTLFNIFLKKNPCKVFISPCDVKLANKTVLQPDMFVVCDRSKLDGQFTQGAPDLVIEIESSSSTQRDRILKYNKYLDAKVKEYWIVNPESKVTEVFILVNGDYSRKAYDEKDKISVHVLDGCTIDMSEVFAEEIS